jgi:hypothetical protein
MTSNGVASGAVQAMSAIPVERVSEHATRRVVKDQAEPERPDLDRMTEGARQVASGTYNSHGEVVPVPPDPEADFHA